MATTRSFTRSIVEWQIINKEDEQQNKKKLRGRERERKKNLIRRTDREMNQSEEQWKTIGAKWAIGQTYHSLRLALMTMDSTENGETKWNTQDT